jgi:hypothetical protein
MKLTKSILFLFILIFSYASIASSIPILSVENVSGAAKCELKKTCFDFSWSVLDPIEEGSIIIQKLDINSKGHIIKIISEKIIDIDVDTDKFHYIIDEIYPPSQKQHYGIKLKVKFKNGTIDYSSFKKFSVP